ncbi:MAG: tripartite tricarboxylate transporter substrate binding protein [Limnochordia bacterium]|jgi:tripartite-type tricarboxylate transporter receptor subunit TctC
MMRLVKGMGVILTIVLLFSVVALGAANWPSKPITMQVAWSAGGGSDITARLLMPYVEEIIGGSIIVVNRPGAGGEIGFTELAKAAPDGYYFGWTNTPNSVAFPIARETNYQIEDFAPVANVIYDPGVLVVRTDSPYQTLEDFIADARQKPNTLTVGNSGTGGDDYIAVATLENMTGISVNQVPFEGAAPNITAVLGGHVSAGAINASEVKPYVESGQMRVLGLMDTERCHLIPDVPTFRELGYDVVSGSARGFSAPAGTPREIVEKMAAAVEQAMQNPDFLKKAEEAFLLLKFMGPDEYQAYLFEVRDTIQALYDQNPW